MKLYMVELHMFVCFFMCGDMDEGTQVRFGIVRPKKDETDTTPVRKRLVDRWDFAIGFLEDAVASKHDELVRSK